MIKGPSSAAVAPRKVGIYPRVSTEEQARGESIANQISRCRGYIQTCGSKEWVVSDVYSDEGYGGDTRDRPGLRRLLADIDAGKIDVVVVAALDRFTRNVRHGLELMDRLAARKVALYSVVDGKVSTDDPSAFLMLLIRLGSSENELTTIRRRTSEGVAAAIANGRRIGGGAPLGYDFDPNGKHLVLNEKEARIVREIFDMAGKGLGPHVIAMALNTRGERTKIRVVAKENGETVQTGGRLFHNDYVRRIIRDRTYIGLTRTTKYMHNATNPPEFVDENDYGYYRASHPSIVSEKVWDLANDRNKRKARPERAASKWKAGYLLAGIAKCGTHKTALTAAPSGKKRKDGSHYRYYSCVRRNKFKEHDDCSMGSISAEPLETVVIEYLSRLALADHLVSAIVEASQVAEPTRVRGIKSALKDNEREQASLNTQKRNCVEVLAQLGREGLSDELREKVADLNRRLGELATLRMNLERELADSQAEAISADVARSGLQRFTELVRVLPAVDQRRLVHLLVKEVVVSRRKTSSDCGREEYRATIRMRMAALSHLSESDAADGMTIEPSVDAKGKDSASLTAQVVFRTKHLMKHEPIEFVSPAIGTVVVGGKEDGERRGVTKNPHIMHPALSKARDFQARIEGGEVKNMTAFAKSISMTPASICGYLRLLTLPHTIIAFLEKPRDPTSWKAMPLRRLIEIARLPEAKACKAFATLKERSAP